MFRHRKILLPALALVTALPVFAWPAASVYAHGFGERYDLPLPLSYFTAAGAAAVIFSFVVIGVFVRAETSSAGYPRLNLFRYAPLRAALSGPVFWLVRLASLLLFFLVIATGLFGSDRPVDNLTPTFVWIIWWVGMGFVVSLLGNLWAVVNPWRTIYDLAEGLYHRIWPNRSEWELGLGWDYPDKLGVWPAVFLFFAFSWVENALPESASPSVLAGLIIAYSILTLVGMYLFGRRQWLRHSEVFSVIYGFLTRFSITEARAIDPAACWECTALQCRAAASGFQPAPGKPKYDPTSRGARLGVEKSAGCVDCYECFEYAAERELNLRPPAIGLNVAELNRGGAATAGIATGMTALVLLTLATVTFDGFSDTPEWAATLGFFLSQTPGLTSSYFNGLVIAHTLGLLSFPLAFAAIYWGSSGLMRRMAGSGPAAAELMTAFVFSLVPIALAYHFAHYLGFLLIQGQLLIPLASDPFGTGLDLFGGADYTVNIAITNARFVWFFATTSIVVGHILAVYLAHLRAGAVYRDRRLALRSQLPMLALMVIYTWVSLWIISRPITE